MKKKKKEPIRFYDLQIQSFCAFFDFFYAYLEGLVELINTFKKKLKVRKSFWKRRFFIRKIVEAYGKNVKLKKFVEIFNVNLSIISSLEHSQKF